MSTPLNIVLGIGVATAAVLAPQLPWLGADPVGATPVAAVADDAPVVPAARFPADPADSVYQLARTAFNRGDFDRAQRLFQELRERWPDSEYRASALYFGAYALYRLDGSENLRRARELLAEHAALRVEDAARGDADALSARVEGRLAQLGDPRAAENVVRSAERAAGASATGGGGTSGTNGAGATAGAGAGVPMGAVAGSAAGRASAASSQDCPRERDDERITALNALMQMDADRALPLLQRVLARRDECSATLRRRAVWLVAQQQGTAREDMLLEVVRTDPDAEVRSQAVFWLSSIESERATEILEELLRTSTDHQVRDRAIYSLSAQKSPRARRALREFAMRSDAPRQLRGQAIYWLGQHTDAEGVEYLRRLYATLDDQSLKERVLFTLAQTKGVGNERWLMERVQDANETPAMRGRAIFHLGQGGLLSTAELGGLYDRLTDRQVKEQAIFALAQRGDTASVEKLMNIARREQDRALRERAIFWLSQSKDPRVAEFLLEIIDR